MSDLGASAAAEWDALVAVAVVGTDRRLPPPPQPGWDTWSHAEDPAVQVLDRAAAVVAARRAGALPLAPSDVVVPLAPADSRPPCSTACVRRLQRLLAGEHTVLLPEWFGLVEESGCALPWEMLPTLLLRGRREPSLDLTVRRLAGGRAEWLADLVPELGVSARSVPGSRRGDVEAPVAPPPVADSAASASAIVAALAEGGASWTMVPHFERVITTLDPDHLEPLAASLSSLSFDVTIERTRTALLSLVEFRIEMRREFSPSVRGTGTGTGTGTRTGTGADISTATGDTSP